MPGLILFSRILYFSTVLRFSFNERASRLVLLFRVPSFVFIHSFLAFTGTHILSHTSLFVDRSLSIRLSIYLSIDLPFVRTFDSFIETLVPRPTFTYQVQVHPSQSRSINHHTYIPSDQTKPTHHQPCTSSTPLSSSSSLPSQPPTVPTSPPALARYLTTPPAPPPILPARVTFPLIPQALHPSTPAAPSNQQSHVPFQQQLL